MEKNKIPYEFKTAPAVFAVNNDYKIMVMTRCELTFWVTVGDEAYYDHTNGIMRSATDIHSVTVPMSVLDGAKKYTVHYRRVLERKPNYPLLEEEKSITFDFRPIKTNGELKIYHIADTHGDEKFSIAAGQYFGDELDLLVLNGDLPDHSGDVKNFGLIYKLCGNITGGNIPCVFSRGNHDTRGFCAEKITKYTPTDNGKSYYTFRLGRIWGIVLDTAEDKIDGCIEYNGTVCCEIFRREETKFLEDVIKRADTEYDAEGIEYRIVVSHTPFTRTMPEPFDIEKELFQEWTDLLKEHVRPDLMLCGHLHETRVCHIGDEYDNKGQPCTVIVGANPLRQGKRHYGYVGAAITLDCRNVKVEFTDHEQKVLESEEFTM